MLQKHVKLEVSFIESVKAKEEMPKSALPQMATWGNTIICVHLANQLYSIS